MASLRKANSYSKRKVVPYTRISKKRQKSFIKTVPQQRIVKFTMGKEGLYNKGKFPHVLTMICDEPHKVQMRHNALEACRQYINKQIDNRLAGQYMFKVIPFPHHVQRENRMLTGAGADRMQTGMQLSFGKATNKAAILKQNSRLFVIAVPTEKDVIYARSILKKVNPKIPCKTKIIYQKKE
jgi:large subunit ribosomal protein L10e